MVCQVAIQLVYTGLLARLIPSASFGTMGIVLGLMGFAEIFSQVGIGPALIQRKEVHAQHITGAFYTAVLLGIGFSLLFAGLSPWIAAQYGIPELSSIIPVVATSFTVSALAVVPRSMLMKEMRFRTFFRASMVSIVGGNLVIGLVMAVLGYGIWAYVWALFAQNTLMTLALWYYRPARVGRRWQWRYTRELMAYGAGSTLFNALNYLATKLDVLFVPYVLKGNEPLLSPQKAEAASMYERSNYIMTQPVTVMAKLSDSVLFSGMSKMQDETERLTRTIRLAIALLSAVLIPSVVFNFFYAGDLLRVWLGEGYTAACPILAVLFVAMYFRVISKLGDSLLRARDVLMRGSLIKALYLVLIAAGVTLTARHSMVAVAWAIVVATAIHCLMNLMLVLRLLGIRFGSLWRAWLPGLMTGMVSLLTCMMLWYANGWLHLTALPSLLAGIGANAVAVFLFIGRFPASMRVGQDNLLLLLPEKVRATPLFRILGKRLMDRGH